MRITKAAVAVGLVLVAGAAQATNGMRMIGFGPVQDSMGGASVAAPLDAATAITNPAGLGALSRRADLAGTFFNPAPEYAAQGGGSGSSISSDRGASYIPALGLAWP